MNIIDVLLVVAHYNGMNIKNKVHGLAINDTQYKVKLLSILLKYQIIIATTLHLFKSFVCIYKLYFLFEQYNLPDYLKNKFI